MHEKNVPNNVVHLNALKSCGCHAFILILWIKNSKNIFLRSKYLFYANPFKDLNRFTLHYKI